MSRMLITDCCRCGQSLMTMDVLGHVRVPGQNDLFETFCRCRLCKRSAIYVLYNVQTNQDPSQYEHALDDYFTVKGVVQPRAHAVRCPDHVPHAIRAVFDEGTDCLSIDCWNAAGAMFRKVLDLATKEKVPPGTKQQMLKARLEFLFANSLLPPGIKPLADCIREDGNDAVHEHPIGKDDAEDLLDFTTEVLEVLYTGPGKIIEAAKRTEARRAKPD